MTSRRPFTAKPMGEPIRFTPKGKKRPIQIDRNTWTLHGYWIELSKNDFKWLTPFSDQDLIVTVRDFTGDRLTWMNVYTKAHGLQRATQYIERRRARQKGGE